MPVAAGARPASAGLVSWKQRALAPATSTAKYSDNRRMKSCRYQEQYPELFAPLSPEARENVSDALASSRLESGEASRAHVALLIRSVTENMTDDEYRDAVLEHVTR